MAHLASPRAALRARAPSAGRRAPDADVGGASHRRHQRDPRRAPPPRRTLRRPCRAESLLGLGNLPYARWFKTVSSLKKRCEDCYIVRRGKITYNYCKTHPRHKQRQGARWRKGHHRFRKP